MNRNHPKLCIVVPCYNEEEILPTTIERLTAVLDNLVINNDIDSESILCFIDDGSKDKTWDILASSNQRLKSVKAIRLSRNYGHQQALLAGLSHVTDKADCVISIDADLQQDESTIPLFIEKYKAGADIVFGVREDRSSDSFLKKWTALLFYKIMDRLGTPLIKNHADYRLTSRKALKILSEYRETNVFLRGIFADMGLRRDFVTFSVKERSQGTSKYTTGKMISFAIHGISSFSVAPLRIISILGIIIFSLSALMGLYIIFRSLLVGDTIPGWASTTLPIYFLGGLQTLCIGVIGEYVGNIYKETKSRPKFIINERLDE